MRRLPPLSALRAFEAAARLGSFKRAAEELAVTPTAISHQIRGLEAQLGQPLFLRQVRQVALTDAGRQLYPVLQQGFDAFEAALARLLKGARRDRVTISATHSFTAKWLVPRVARFHAQHPDIDLQLLASDHLVDLARSDIDLAVRYGRGPYPGLRAEIMFEDRFAPVANPLLRVGDVEALARLPLIHFTWQHDDPANPTWQNWFAQAGLTPAKRHGQLVFSDESHAIQAALAGQGIGLVSLAMVQAELDAGQLQQPFGPVIDGHTYHLLRGPRDSSSVQAVVQWLRDELAQHR